MHQEIDQDSAYDSKPVDQLPTIDDINIVSAEICGSTEIVEFQICRVLLARYMLVNDIRYVTALVELPRQFVYWVWARAQKLNIITSQQSGRKWLVQWEENNFGGLGTLMDAMSVSGRVARHTTRFKNLPPDIKYEESSPNHLDYRWDLGNSANELAEYRHGIKCRSYKIPKIVVDFGNAYSDQNSISAV